MNVLTAVLIGAILSSGCSVTGHYRAEGPCQGFRTDPDACERAYANSLVVGKIKLGQPLAEVRGLMGRDPERREASAGSEAWWYLTDYANQIYTIVVFRQGSVSEIRQSSAQ